MSKVIRIASVMLIVLFVIICALAWSGLRVNNTPSYPKGLYWSISKTPAVGDLVMFCPVDNQLFQEAKQRRYIGTGFCDGGYGFLIKKILAAKGDVISVTDQGVTVNGTLVPHSRPFLADNVGQQMPLYRVTDHQLINDEVLLMSDYSGVSFDARYYGIQHYSQIKSVITPLLTE